MPKRDHEFTVSDERSAEAFDGNWHVLVAGLPRPAEPIPLAPGLTLRPLAAPLSVFDLAAAGAAGFRTWAMLEPITRACTCEIESTKDAATLPGYDTLNRAWLASALLVLRGFSKHLPVACSAYSWNLVAGHSQRSSPTFREQLEEEGVEAAVFSSRRALPAFTGQLRDYHLHLLVPPDTRTGDIEGEDAEWIASHFETFNSLAGGSAAFRLGLEAAIDWRFAKEPRAAVARLWAGIEALFGISSELVFRISLLSASLLEPRGERRKARFAAVKKLYGLRSKAVHGEQIAEDKLASAMGESFNLLRELLLLSIEKGHSLGEADFEEALFL